MYYNQTIKKANMINKLITTFCLILIINNYCFSQNFKKEFFSFPDFSFIDEMQHADFNGDGLPDFLIAASNFGKLQVGINTGISAPSFSEISDVTSIQKTEIVDVDGDGDMDIIGLRQFTGVFAFINDGNAGFQSQQLDLSSYGDLTFRDITGDGKLEMLVVSFNLVIYSINSTTLELTEIYSEDFGSGDIGAITTIDDDNDGDLDIILSTESDGLFYLEQTTPLTFESSILYTDSYDVDNIEIVNLNNDNVIDFVLYSVDDQRGKVVISTNNGEYIEEILNEEGIKNTLTLVGDLNQDQKEEIITFENTSFVDPTMYIKEYSNGLVNLETVQDHFASFGGGIVDVDNDGNQDFYFFQNDNSNPGLVFYLNEGVSSTYEISNSIIDIYPNPATNIININVVGNLNYKSELYDYKGELILTNSNKNQLYISSIPAGIYLLRITDMTTNGSVIERIMIGR
jgi:hypothetical protein